MGDDANDLDQGRIGKTSGAGGGQRCRVDPALTAGHFGSEAHGGVGLGIGRSTSPVGADFCRIKFGEMGGEIAVGRAALIAAIGLGDRQRNPFAGLQIKLPLAQGGAQVEIAR